MRESVCEQCLCNSCMQNAEDYADGMCRKCEQCEIEERKTAVNICKYYTSDNDSSSLI